MESSFAVQFNVYFSSEFVIQLNLTFGVRLTVLCVRLEFSTEAIDNYNKILGVVKLSSIRE